MKLNNFLGSILILLAAGCAGQRLPEGGPADTVPPEILSVFPQPGTVNYSGNSVVIEFSEYVDRRSTEEAVFISPNVEEKEFEWSGTELEIVFNEELRKNTTYVVTIGTDVTDIRARNRMARSVTLSFSTGPVIDNGMIEGKVHDEKPEGVMIFSYRLNGIRPDTLNPAVTKPDYLTQTGMNGEFLLTNIAPGSYRLYAVKDEYRNLLYEPETDAAGTTDDVVLTEKDTLRSGVAFTIAKEDTTSPRISQVQAPDDHHITVQFSEAMDSASVQLSAFAVTDTLFRTVLPVSQFFTTDEGYRNIMLVTDKQTADERYVVTVLGVKDRNGFSINRTANAKQFNGSAVKDTIPPEIRTVSVKDQSVKFFPDDGIIISFTDAVKWPVPDTMITIRREKDSTIVPAVRGQRTPSTVSIRSAAPLVTGEMYSLRLRLNGFNDHLGNAGKDTVLSYRFLVEDPENYGSIEGSFTGYTESRTVVQAENLSEKKQGAITTRTTKSGGYSFQRLTEGKYALKAFDDLNDNLKLDAGTVYPYRRSERFTNFPDTIRVRARWPVDGVNFKAP